MVEAGRLVEQPQQRRQVGWKSPVVLSTPKPLHAGRGFVPPRRDRPRNRLDDEHSRSAGGSVELKPGGMHLMFIGLKAPLRNGDTFPMTLRFEKAGEVVVTVNVEVPQAAEPAHKH